MKYIIFCYWLPCLVAVSQISKLIPPNCTVHPLINLLPLPRILKCSLFPLLCGTDLCFVFTAKWCFPLPLPRKKPSHCVLLPQGLWVAKQKAKGCHRKVFLLFCFERLGSWWWLFLVSPESGGEATLARHQEVIATSPGGHSFRQERRAFDRDLGSFWRGQWQGPGSSPLAVACHSLLDKYSSGYAVFCDKAHNSSLRRLEALLSSRISSCGRRAFVSFCNVTALNRREGFQQQQFGRRSCFSW